MEQNHSPLPWILDGVYIVTKPSETMPVGFSIADCGKSLSLGRGVQAANADLIVRSVNAMPELVKALEDLQQRAGAVATWLNHWDLSFADQDEWRGPTGDCQLFFNALNEAAAVLAKVKP